MPHHKKNYATILAHYPPHARDNPPNVFCHSKHVHNGCLPWQNVYPQNRDRNTMGNNDYCSYGFVPPTSAYKDAFTVKKQKK
jgi:hypothetical protein